MFSIEEIMGMIRTEAITGEIPYPGENCSRSSLGYSQKPNKKKPSDFSM